MHNPLRLLTARDQLLLYTLQEASTQDLKAASDDMYVLSNWAEFNG